MSVIENVYVYQSCFWHCIWHDKCRLSLQTFDFYGGYVSGEARLPSSGREYILLNTFELIKTVSDTVLDMINAAYHDKPLIFIGATFRKKLDSHHQAVNEADSCLLLKLNVVVNE